VATRKTRPGDGLATLNLGDRRGVRILQIADNHFFCGVMSGLAATDTDRATERDWQALPVLAEGGRIRACFCGHDHTNDHLVRSRDMDLVHGRSTGHSGYGGEKVRKGAKLIELDFVIGAYTQVSVFPDGTSWIPT
jgi:hypothetical protein